MPAPAGAKRMKGVQVHRPFVFGSEARLFSQTNPRPPNTPSEHTHSWTVYIRPLTTDHDITHWLRKVQFKLHETYTNNTIIRESPQQFTISETGWGEFEVQMKLFFVPESNEKAGTLWHALKLHPYGTEEMKEEQRKTGLVRSECYEEVVFSEPVEAFFEVLTRENVPGAKGGGGKGGRGGKGKGGQKGRATAEVPQRESRENPFCTDREAVELARIKEAGRKVEESWKRERETLLEKEREKEELVKEAG